MNQGQEILKLVYEPSIGNCKGLPKPEINKANGNKGLPKPGD